MPKVSTRPCNRALLIIVGLLPCVPMSFGGEITFAKPPTVKVSGGSIDISFSVSASVETEVSILNAQKKVVRHLAAGLLGDHSPKPFQKGLSQTLRWDGKDDFGTVLKTDGCSVRVALGRTPKLQKHLGWDGNCFQGKTVKGLAVGPDRKLYVLLSHTFYGRVTMRVYDPQGNYLKTIMPYPANTPVDRTENIPDIALAHRRLPMVFNGHNGNVYPLTNGMKKQRICFTSKGHIIMASGVGTMAEHGPPRHLLALDPQGGAPKGLSFVGPEIRKPVGFLGGSGEATCRYFDHVTASPDGEWIYLTTSYIQSERLKRELKDTRIRQSVFRFKWRDETIGKPFLGEDRVAGSDEKHFNDPQGLCVDPKGNLYVCDRGNNRVVIFSPSGERQGSFAVPLPQQIEVHPVSGEMYIVSRGSKGSREAPTSVLYKFSAFKQGEAAPKELKRLEKHLIEVMTLDAKATPPRLWLAMRPAKGAINLVSVADDEAGFSIGKMLNNNKALDFNMFVAADPLQERVIVREMRGGRRWGFMQLDLNSGKLEDFKMKGADLVFDRKGQMYVMDGYNTNSLSRYDASGKPMPFKATGSHRLKMEYRGYGPDLGLRGHCIGANGNLYVIRSRNGGHPDVNGGRVDCFDADGNMQKKNIIDGMGYGDCGLGVDVAGNIYVGANVKSGEQPFPKPFMNKITTKTWNFWKGKNKVRETPWHYMYLNPYLFFWGSVFKFGPEGGAFYGYTKEPAEGKARPISYLEKAPQDSKAFKSAYLGRDVKVTGMQWQHLGVGIVPSSSDGPLPDPGCVCWTSRLAVDAYGRVYAPNVFEFCVDMLDAAGNRMKRIGDYGNVDDAGPDIKFAWPAFVSVLPGGEKLMVSDMVSRRVAVIEFEAAKVVVCPVE